VSLAKEPGGDGGSNITMGDANMASDTRKMGLVLSLVSAVAFTVSCKSDDDSSSNGGPDAGTGGAAGPDGAGGSDVGEGGATATGGAGGEGGEAGAPVTGGVGGSSGAAGAPPVGEGGNGGTAAGGASGAGGEGGGAMAEPTVVELAIAAGSFTSLVAALEAADLVGALSGEGPFTVFAPDDAAFAAFEDENPGVLASLTTDELTAVLTYHVLAAEVRASDLVDGAIAETLNGAYVGIDLSDGVEVGGANVTAADLTGRNGVIHVIDRVILPPRENLVETAVSAGSFTQLAAALVATGLDATLADGGPFTVFAPTDDAFAAFEAANPGVLASLTEAELTDVLLYHVVDGWVGAADLVDGSSVPTLLNDASLTIDLSSGVVVNESSVVAANVLATNGVIHVIDEILLPPSP